MRVIIAGSRGFTDFELITRVVRKLSIDHPDLVIISGMAPGADTLGFRAAVNGGIPIEGFQADWERDGRSAGYRRNQRMEKAADMAIVFFAPGPLSPGSLHMVNIMKQARKPVHVYHEGVWA